MARTTLTLLVAVAGAVALAGPATAQEHAPSCDLDLHREAGELREADDLLQTTPDGRLLLAEGTVVVTPGPQLTLQDIQPGAVVRAPQEAALPAQPTRQVTLAPVPAR